MSKVSIIERNEKRLKLSRKHAEKRSKLKEISKNKSLSLEERFQATVKLAKLPRNSAPIRHRNRCAITGRPRGYYRKLGVSRIAVRDLTAEGQIPGMIKSSWWGINMMTDPLADMLTRIRNALLRNKTSVLTPASKLRENVLLVLQDEGYIRGYTRIEVEGHFPMFEIELKYHEGDPVIKKLERVSKPGRRVYSSVTELPRVFNGLGVSILSTSKGVMSDVNAREANVGGEILCKVF